MHNLSRAEAQPKAKISQDEPIAADLGRTFTACAPEGEDQDRDYWRFLRKRRGEPQDWGWLLKSPLVVILDEAGAGKTTEFRDRVKRLRTAGQDAFFFRIEKLCRTDLAEALDDAADVRLLSRWRSTRRRAIFFLDSVDEAKLPTNRDVNPLQAAIRRLELSMGRAWPRVRLVVSSRPSAWTAELELAETRRLERRYEALGIAGDEADVPVARFVRFDPLDADQQAALAAHDGAPAGFLQDLHSSGAAELAGTPLDLLDLSAAYKAALDEGRSGAAAFESLARIVDRAIDRRATESGIDHARTNLSSTRIRAGARRLAYACVLGHHLSICLPGAGGEGLDPQAALVGCDPEWSRSDIAQLLATGLFTAAWAGAVRFHHRRTMERLAAEAFDDLLRAGLEVDVLAEALLPEAFGLASVPATFAETIGWLATLNSSFRARVAVSAPHLLLELGDPGVLPTVTRETALRGHVARYAEVEWRGEWFPNVRLARFVDPLLADVCAELLAPCEPVEPLGHVLQIIELGCFHSCADAVAAVVRNTSGDLGLRARAIATLAVVGQPAHLASLSKLTRAIPRPQSDPDGHARHVRNHFRRVCVVAGRPRYMSLSSALGCLIRLEPRDRTYASMPDGELIDAVVDRCPPQQLPLLVRWLSKACWETSQRRFGDLDVNRWTDLGWHLLPVLEAACAKCLEERPDLHDWSVLVAECDRILAARQVGGGALDSHYEWADDRFARAVDTSPSLRRAMFVASAEVATTRVSHSQMLLNRITHWRRANGSSSVVASDIQWLESLYATHSVEAVRQAALDALSIRVPHLSRSEFHITRRRILAIARGRGDREGVSAIAWSPRRTWDRLRWRVERTASALRRYRNRFRRDWTGKVRRHAELHLFAADVAKGNRANLAIWALFGRAYDRTKLFDGVRGKFGRRIADSLREGAKAYALRHDPGPVVARHTYGDRYAAIGWEALALDDPGQVDLLPEGDARRAILALLKEDEFPAWVRRLATRLPALWREINAPLLEQELAVRPRPNQPTYAAALSRIANAEGPLRVPLAGVALGGLEANQALSPDDVSRAVEIVLTEPGLHASLLALASARCRSWLAVGEFRDAAPWLKTWLYLDPEGAWDGVRSFVNGPWCGDDDLVVGLAGELHGLRSRGDGANVALSRYPPAVLAQLAIDLRKHVRPDLDVGFGDHGLRHNAQELRDGVLRMLSLDPSVDAHQALLLLKDDPNYVDWRHYLARLIQEQAALAAAPRPWTTEQATQFATIWTRRPQSAVELTELVRRQIDSIISGLATSEFDMRGLFRGASERDLRAFLGAALDARSQGWFGVTQEAVTAEEKRRDLRIEARSSLGEVSTVELKIAGASWTGDELVGHIESQLVRQYLLSRHVRCGLYVVIAFDRKTWPMADGTTLDFDGLAARLSAEAEAVATRNPDLEVLKVIARRVVLPPNEQPKRKPVASGQ